MEDTGGMEKSENNVKKWTYYIIVAVSIAVTAGLGALFTRLGTEWYDTLNKPTEWVPSILIPIIWAVIYLAFAIILIFFKSKLNLVRRDYVLLVLNGVFNVLWCLVYFTLKEILWGEVIIIINFVLSTLLITSMYRDNKTIACVLIMYPAWLAIATALNTAIWILN